MLSLSISYPYFIDFHNFADNIQEGMKHQMGWCNSGPTGLTFWITLIFGFYFLPWESDPSQNVKTGSVLKLDARWKPERFSSPVRTFNPVLMAVLISDSHWPLLIEGRTQNRRWFSLSRWEPPNTDHHHHVLGKCIKFPHNKMQISSLPERRFSIMQEILSEIEISFFGYHDHNILENFNKFPHNTMQVSSLPETSFSIMQEILPLGNCWSPFTQNANLSLSNL